MAWNNGRERKRFDEEQKRLAVEYRAAGMSEDQIEQMHQFDLKVFNSTRRFYEHTQQIPNNIFGTDDEGLCPLNDKFLEAMSVTIEQSDAKTRYWWIEEIENLRLLAAIRELSIEAIELITQIVFDELSQEEIANTLEVSQPAVSLKLKKILENLKKCL